MDILALLRGPAARWPRSVDAGSEAWARLPARARAALGTGVAVLLVVAATGGLLEGPWGPPVGVLVATRDIAPGEVVGPADVAAARRPADVVPADPLPGLPSGAVATGHVPRGAVVTAGHVLAGGPSAQVPPGRAIVPVPVDLLPQLPAGTSLRVVAPGFDGSAVTVAVDAELVADDGVHRWLSVQQADVAGVAAAVARGSLVVGVLPRAPGP